MLALSDNKIRGVLPPCMADMHLIDWIYVENNLLHGPVSEFSPLGHRLKNVQFKSLDSNRWAPLLPEEKQNLLEVAGPIGIVESDRDWDFHQTYRWADQTIRLQGDLTAEREVSYRWWRASIVQHDFSFALPFKLPYQGRRVDSFTVGQEGRFQDIVSHRFDEPHTLESDTLVDTIDHLGDTYTVSVEITPTGVLGNVGSQAWGSIVRLTTTDTNCCHPGDHVLGLWFDPGTLKLSLGLSKPGGGWPSVHRKFSLPLPIGEPTLLEVQFTSKGCAAYVDGAQRLYVPILRYGPRTDDPTFTKNVKLYAAEPHSFYRAALASIRDLRVDIGRHYWSSDEGASCDDVISQHFDEPHTLAPDTLVDTFDHLGDTYRVSVEITPTNGTVDRYGSIFRLTTTEDRCCKAGDVIIGVWFAPGSLQLSLGLGKPPLHILNRDPLVIGQPALLEVQFTSAGCTAYVDGDQRMFVPVSDSEFTESTALTDNVKLYAAEHGSFSPAARASIRNLQIAVPVSVTSDEPHNAAQTLPCWADISTLVPSSHVISDASDSSVSLQGADYFAQRFCSNWLKYVKAAVCSESDLACDARGNAIFDGGDDMYDIGNFIATNLMDSCRRQDYLEQYQFGSGDGSDTHTPDPCTSHSDCIQGAYCDSTSHCWECEALGDSIVWETYSCDTAELRAHCGSSQAFVTRCNLDIGCPLGSLHYQTGFENVDTGCFGPGGSYRMGQLGDMWIFLTHNAGDSPLDFMVLGQLGADNAGSVTEFVLEAPPFIGFVKRVCGAGDPSINHLIVVDSSGGLPSHSCDYERGSACNTAASTDLDDDIVSGIVSGSPILYLLYSSEAGYCIKEDEHNLIFDLAVHCLWVDNPFAATGGPQHQPGIEPLLEIDVDEQGHIVYGGTGAYTGWARGGGPDLVAGPGGANNGALQFSSGQWLQLGRDDGIKIPASWTLDIHVNLQQHVHGGPLLYATDGSVLAGLGGFVTDSGWHHVTVSRIFDHLLTCSSRKCEELGWSNYCGESDNEAAGWQCTMEATQAEAASICEGAGARLCTGQELAAGAGQGSGCSLDSRTIWSQSQDLGDLNCSDGDAIIVPGNGNRANPGNAVGRAACRSKLEHAAGVRCCADNNRQRCDKPTPSSKSVTTTFVDGLQVAREVRMQTACELDDSCQTRLVAVGSSEDGTRYFRLPISRLRLSPGIRNSTEFDAFSPLPFHAENSRWLEISTGLDGVDMTWDTFGVLHPLSGAHITHEQVMVSLKPTGDIAITAGNDSALSLWDRSISAVSGIAGDVTAERWTSTALHFNTNRTAGVQIAYIGSDPCFDLWRGIECRPSDWPVGNDDCELTLSCSGLSWDASSRGHTDVCGKSALISQRGNSDMCMRESTYADAHSLCEELGSRLCTVAELARGEGEGEACGYDSVYNWAWAAPDGGVNDQCSGNESLGIAGQPTEWYSFSPTADTFHEVRLLAEIEDQWFSSSIAADIYDGYGDHVLTRSPPTLHTRRHGSMLRWNTSAAGNGPFFVRMSATASHSVVVAAPVPYQIVPVALRSLRLSTTTSLLTDIEDTLLPFPFSFYGITYDRVWVSTAGWISFEQQHSGTFADTGSIHSAVVACSAVFGAAAEVTTTVAQTETELQIRWQGSLFNSLNTEQSDVCLSLQSNGSLVIDWTEINLPSGGSLATGLAVWLLSSFSPNVTDQISDESGSGLAASVVLGEDASARVMPIDPSQYFGETECADDPDGVLEVLGMDCANGYEMISTSANPGTDACDYDLSLVLQALPPGSTPRTLCPVTCGECGGASASKPSESESYGGTSPDSFFVAVSAEGGQTFDQARAHCKAHHTDLASIHSAGEMHMAVEVCGHLTDNSDQHTPCFIGLHANEDGAWEWADSSSSDWILEQMLDGSGSWVGFGEHESNSGSNLTQPVPEVPGGAGSGTECADDPEGQLAAQGFGCSQIVLMGCERDLHPFQPGVPEGTLVSVVCPASCGLCEDANLEPCTSPTEFAALMEPMSAACCVGNLCNGGVPTSCLGDCATVLLPLQAACGQFLSSTPGMAPFVAMIDSAATLCLGEGGSSGHNESEMSRSSALFFQDVSEQAVAFICEDRARSALDLVGDARIQLPPMTVGGKTVAVSSWVQLGGDEDQLALISSYQSAECGITLQCKNAVGDALSSHGWLGIGTENGHKLFVAGAVFDSAMADEFFEPAYFYWALLTFSFIERTVHAYFNGRVVGVGFLEAELPRMLRSENSIGGSLGAQPLSAYSRFSVADFKIYDRSISSMEADALHADPSSRCCVGAGMIDAFGVGSIDLTAEVMAAVDHSASVVVSPELTESNGAAIDSIRQPCNDQVISDASAAVVREVDVCGDESMIKDPVGTLSDGRGPYGSSSDCSLRLQCYRGGQYTLAFEQFETADSDDKLEVHDGSSAAAPLLGSFSGTELPPTLISTGPDFFLVFTSNSENQASGFVATFACSGDPVEYLKPSDVATRLSVGATVSGLAASELHAACLSGVLLSVQCCADAEKSCANSRVIGLGLSGQQLRGSLPEAIGHLGALNSLKLHDNFLTGTFPSSLGRLHWLRELQLSHNQFEMQDRDSLSTILSGMPYLSTLDLGMSDEKEDLGKSIITPAAPLDCRVGAPCDFTLSTRTSSGLQLPHGGLEIKVHRDTIECKLDESTGSEHKQNGGHCIHTIDSTQLALQSVLRNNNCSDATSESSCPSAENCRWMPTATSDSQSEHDNAACTVSCVDQMDGSYECPFPWTSEQGEFDFVPSADGEEFMPIRTLTDPTTGVKSTAPTCKWAFVV